jgi:queuine tRNA-ribosyltransferase
MGVGFPRDIVAAVASGVDMFDCVMPTRNGRNAYAFTAGGAIRLRNSRYIADRGPIEPGCDCYACRNFTRGAIRHFFFAGEMLGPVLASVHNMRFYQRLMSDLRQSIADGTFEQFRRTDPRCGLGPRADHEVNGNGD